VREYRDTHAQTQSEREMRDREDRHMERERERDENTVGGPRAGLNVIKHLYIVTAVMAK